MNTNTIKSSSVKSFFDNTDVYLNKGKNPQIKLRAEIVKEFTGDIQNQKILDLGCGDGTLTIQFLDKNNVTFVDISEKMLQKVNENIPNEFKNNAKIINQGINELEFTEKFDLIVCVGVLSHVDSYEETISKIAHFLKKGGTLILQITDNNKLWGKFVSAYPYMFKKSSGYRVNRLKRTEIMKSASQNNFNLVSQRKYLPMILGLGSLPYELRYKLQKNSMNNKALGFFCSELILKFLKN